MKIFKVTIEEIAKDMTWIIKWVIKKCSMYLLIWLADGTNYNIIEHTKDLFKKKKKRVTTAFKPD